MNDHPTPTRLVYFSDLLCIWAYLAQVKLVQIQTDFGGACRVEHRYITLFGDTKTKLVEGWKERGGLAAYRDHVLEVTADFDDPGLHTNVWNEDPPPSSTGLHVWLAAARQTAPSESGEALAWALRRAFFRDGLNIARPEVYRQLTLAQDIDPDELAARVADGRAHAAYEADVQLAREWNVTGSPTYVLNEGRQKLFGNVGYRIIEANIRELHERPGAGASWC